MSVRLVPLRYDAARVQTLVGAFAVEMVQRYDGDPDDPAGSVSTADPEDFDTPRGIFLLAVDPAGEDVGCGGLRTLRTGVGELKRMYVAPAGRRQGVGRALLRALVAQARRQGLTELLLETGTAQPEALALYESEGWRRIPPYGTFRDDPASVCFALELPPLPADDPAQ